LGVLQAGVELERLSALAPNAILYRDLCRAYVALARGEHQAALAIYERTEALPHARLMRVWELDRSFYAEALLRVGKLEEAKRVCQEVIRVRTEQGASLYALRLPQQQLALAEAKLGERDMAKQRLAELLRVVTEHDSPMAIGQVCRDQARIALLERDAPAFEHNFGAMVQAFRRTKNPILVQQCRRLLAEAEKSGVVAAPNWEKHELLAPANTQDLASQAPEVTELLETYS
jgi:tetratricopeptide (TPR) repeat protein